MTLERQRVMTRGLIIRYGGGVKATLRRMHSLKASGRETNALVVKGDHAAGAATLTVDGVDNGGVLKKGCRVTVAAVVYEATADATVAGGQLVIPITPAVSAPIADNAAATITRTYGEHEYYRRRNGGATIEEDQEVVASGLVVDLAYESTLPAPDNGDALVEAGVSRYIHSVQELGSAGVSGYRLVIGVQQ